MTVRMPCFPILRCAAAAGLVLAFALAPAVAAEQTAKLPPSAYQGLGMSSDQPIQFESEQLEVHDQDKTAVFTGHVIVRQGTTVLKTDRLIVFYAGSPTGEGPQQVSRLEATGSVLVTSPNQTASGDAATFDTAANTIVLTGNVVLTQGDNVIRGAKLQIDINTSQAKMLGGRVQMLIAPKSLGTKG
ncbi:lipopolysaccharide transport periplasmic protein LptA [Pleomorphomonas koreensis]|uniref:lipopolysaccharide transport periplasmic protein LptA n=1 Tax=Pleomorphomonas koreensis TaxID=257440 RepID=UPI0004094F58|nr:lipopolysaccharide transport periplasmic protein LptA [Pleomorphomonas koreensis]